MDFEAGVVLLEEPVTELTAQVKPESNLRVAHFHELAAQYSDVISESPRAPGLKAPIGLLINMCPEPVTEANVEQFHAELQAMVNNSQPEEELEAEAEEAEQPEEQTETKVTSETKDPANPRPVGQENKKDKVQKPEPAQETKDVNEQVTLTPKSKAPLARTAPASPPYAPERTALISQPAVQVVPDARPATPDRYSKRTYPPTVKEQPLTAITESVIPDAKEETAPLEPQPGFSSAETALLFEEQAPQATLIPEGMTDPRPELATLTPDFTAQEMYQTDDEIFPQVESSLWVDDSTTDKDKYFIPELLAEDRLGGYEKLSYELVTPLKQIEDTFIEVSEKISGLEPEEEVAAMAILDETGEKFAQATNEVWVAEVDGSKMADTAELQITDLGQIEVEIKELVVELFDFLEIGYNDELLDSFASLALPKQLDIETEQRIKANSSYTDTGTHEIINHLQNAIANLRKIALGIHKIGRSAIYLYSVRAAAAG